MPTASGRIRSSASVMAARRRAGGVSSNVAPGSSVTRSKSVARRSSRQAHWSSRLAVSRPTRRTPRARGRAAVASRRARWYGPNRGHCTQKVVMGRRSRGLDLAGAAHQGHGLLDEPVRPDADLVVELPLAAVLDERVGEPETDDLRPRHPVVARPLDHGRARTAVDHAVLYGDDAVEAREHLGEELAVERLAEAEVVVRGVDAELGQPLAHLVDVLPDGAVGHEREVGAVGDLAALA